MHKADALYNFLLCIVRSHGAYADSHVTDDVRRRAKAYAVVVMTQKNVLNENLKIRGLGRHEIHYRGFFAR